MNWWVWLLIAIAALLIVVLTVSYQDIRRYLRIRHM
jgi:hypothetical protein